MDLKNRDLVTKGQIENKSNRVLYCLDEIDKCAPYFIGIIGNRYGYVPEDITGLDLDNIEQYKLTFSNEKTDKLFTKNGKVYACAIYTFKRGGRKLMYCGTDGTPEGKKALYRIISDDLRLIDRKAWAEVSDAMEHIYINKHGATPIPAEVAQQLLKDKPFIKIHDDGFHYDRYIGGEVHTKIMVGVSPN